MTPYGSIGAEAPALDPRPKVDPWFALSIRLATTPMRMWVRTALAMLPKGKGR